MSRKSPWRAGSATQTRLIIDWVHKHRSEIPSVRNPWVQDPEPEYAWTYEWAQRASEELGLEVSWSHIFEATRYYRKSLYRN